MALDGIFIHHLTSELRNKLLGGRVSKIIQVSDLQMLFSIRSKGNNYSLFVSSNLDSPHINITKTSYFQQEPISNLITLIRKHFEGGYITNISQYQNDRVVIFDFNVSNEIGDIVNKKMIVEIMGRNSNIIFTNDQYVIFDSIRRLPPSIEGLRTILPKAIYRFPISTHSHNPFECSSNEIDLSTLQGVSKLFINEVIDSGNLLSVINRKVTPVMIKTPQKSYFYCFPLQHINGTNSFFLTLSELLDEVYDKSKYEAKLTQQHKEVEKFIFNELQKNQYKLQKLKQELEQANMTMKLQKTGELLSANLYQINQNDTSVFVQDYYNDNQMVEIHLDTNLTPSENLSAIFTKVRKAKNAITQINKQIDLTNDEIQYFEELAFQIENASIFEINEIYEELAILKYIKKNRPVKVKKGVPKYDTYVDHNNVSYLVGKNNVQNAYITHQIAQKNNYFFHVKQAPGSHIIVRIENNISESIIRTAANLAAIHSPMKHSSSVPVDYTQVKNIKKIPGKKGSHVLLFNQKTIYIDPNINLLNDLIKK